MINKHRKIYIGFVCLMCLYQLGVAIDELETVKAKLNSLPPECDPSSLDTYLNYLGNPHSHIELKRPPSHHLIEVD